MPKFEYWDGVWRFVASEDYVNNKIFNINTNTSDSLNINRLQNFPNSNSVFLRGDGVWSTVSPSITLPYYLYTSSLSSGQFNIYNSNNSASQTHFGVYNQNTNNGTSFGINNSTSEGYVWSSALTSLIFGTNNLLRMKINSGGSIDCYTNEILTAGDIKTTAGKVMTDRLSAYSVPEILVSSYLNMQNNDVIELPLIPTSLTSATSKDYVDKRTDKYQTLTYSSNISWNATNGNIAVLTLNGNAVINSISWNRESTFVLYVKQDSIGNRSLNIYGIYRSGSTSSLMPLSTSPNTIDCLIFRWSGESGRIYLTQVINNFQYVPFPITKYIFDYTGSPQYVTIPSSPNNRCLVKVLGAGGGQGIYSAGGNSGAGGYSRFEFITTSYIGQSLFVNVGQGGEGGVCSASGRAGYGGYPNGGGGTSWGSGLTGEYCGGGGGRTEVRIGSAVGVIVAIAGGGAGGSGYASLHGGAGGSNNGPGQNTINGSSFNTGGTLSSGGVSASSPPPGFNQSGFRQGAGFSTPQQYDSYTGGGGGDGYYGGGFYSSYGGGGGGSSYINYGLPYSTILPDVSPSDGVNISSTASSDSDFSGGYGVGRVGTNNGSIFNALRGGNGRAVIEFN